MVTISFETDNAAFHYEDDGSLDLNEISRTLKAVADRIAFGIEEGKISDYNGNVVGVFKVEE